MASHQLHVLAHSASLGERAFATKKIPYSNELRKLTSFEGDLSRRGVTLLRPLKGVGDLLRRRDAPRGPRAFGGGTGGGGIKKLLLLQSIP